MARRRRSGSTLQRDHNLIPTPSSVLQSSLLPDLRVLEDRRTWHPEEPFQPARSSRRVSDSFVTAIARPTKRKASGRPFSLLTPDKFRFAVPDKVLVCVRRKQRREVLHALKKTGKGSRSRFRRRNYNTEVACK